jgi:hypothetical protein
MKWDEEKVGKLRDLINLGKTYKEIGEYFNITVKAVSLKCKRLNLKLKNIYKEKYSCKGCGEEFVDFISNKRKFCSKKCSVIYNNSGRIHSEETKIKISERQKYNVIVKPKKPKERVIKVKPKKDRYCRMCCNNRVENRKLVCDDCKYNFYDKYKPDCVFDFDVKNYPDKFNIDLVKKYGWYSPSNKGNNLNGVSRDHMYSVKDGFINKINPDFIKHPANCQLLKHTDNSIKNSKSIITLDELMERIKNWID